MRTKRIKFEDDIVALLTFGESQPVVLVEREELEMDYGDFVVWFFKENRRLINRCVYRRLIPNRYAPSDVEAYIKERMLDILQKRSADGRPIEDPKIYFKKLIDFYCIEFQRMHGFIYGMPKRPRNTEAEEEIAKYGFVYLYTDSDTCVDFNGQLGYIDTSVTEPTEFEGKFTVKGQDPGLDSEAWDRIMSMALPEDRAVLTCVFKNNMSVPEAARHLDIAITTAYQRKEKGLRAISGTLASFVDLDKRSHQILDDVTGLDPERVDITQFFENRS